MAMLFCIIVCDLQLMLKACIACKWLCSLCYSLSICNCGESLAVASGNRAGLNAHDLECVVKFRKDIREQYIGHKSPFSVVISCMFLMLVYQCDTVFAS